MFYDIYLYIYISHIHIHIHIRICVYIHIQRPFGLGVYVNRGVSVDINKHFTQNCNVVCSWSSYPGLRARMSGSDPRGSIIVRSRYRDSLLITERPQYICLYRGCIGVQAPAVSKKL